MDNINVIEYCFSDKSRTIQLVIQLKDLSQQGAVADLFDKLRDLKQEVQFLLQTHEISAVDRDGILQATRVCHQSLGQCEKDLTVEVEGKELQVNSFMFACLSSRFTALVAARQYAEQSSEDSISLSDMTYAQMECICAFLDGEALAIPTSIAEVEELLQLAELSQDLEMLGIIKACDAAFYTMLNAVPKADRGWIFFKRTEKSVVAQLQERSDLLLRIFKVSGLLNTQQTVGDMRFVQIMGIPYIFDASNRKFLDKVLCQKKVSESFQNVDPKLLARRWGQKTDEQKRKELIQCEKLADELVSNFADLAPSEYEAGDWILEAMFQNDLRQRDLDLFRFFLHIVSSPNLAHRAFLSPIVRALQLSYFAGNLSDEDADWVLRIAGRDKALLQCLEEKKVFFALSDQEVASSVIACSRFVCMARSQVFNRMLDGRFNEANIGSSPQEAITLKDVSTDELQLVLNWMRSETVVLDGLTVEQVLDFFNVLDYFNCKKFKRPFENYLLTFAGDPENVCSLIRISRERDMPYLLQACLKTLSQQYPDMFQANVLPDGRLAISELDRGKVVEYPDLYETLLSLKDTWTQATLKHWIGRRPAPSHSWSKVLDTFEVAHTTKRALSHMLGSAASAVSTTLAPIRQVFSFVPYGSSITLKFFEYFPFDLRDLVPSILPLRLHNLRLETTACRELTNEGLLDLVMSYPELTELTFENDCPLVDQNGWKALAQLNKLKRLTVTLALSKWHTEVPFEKLDINALVPSWPQFEGVNIQLDLQGGSTKDNFEPTPAELVFLSKCPIGIKVALKIPKDFELPPIAEACPSMTSLSSDSAHPISLWPRDAAALANNCPRLERLIAKTILHDDHFTELVEGCQKLIHLKLIHGSKLSDTSFQKLAHYCKNLEEVVLIDYPDLGDAGVQALATLPRLRVIEVVGCLVTDYGIDCLLNRENLPPLESVSALNCSSVSSPMQRTLLARWYRLQSSQIEADKKKVRRWHQKSNLNSPLVRFLGMEAFAKNYWWVFGSPIDASFPRGFSLLRASLAEALNIPAQGTVSLDSGTAAWMLFEREKLAESFTELKDLLLAAHDPAGCGLVRIIEGLSYLASLVDGEQILSTIETYLALSESAIPMTDFSNTSKACINLMHDWLVGCQQLVSEALLNSCSRLLVQPIDIEKSAEAFIAAFSKLDLSALSDTLLQCQRVIADVCRERNLSTEDRMRLLFGVGVLTFAETILPTVVEAIDLLKDMS